LEEIPIEIKRKKRGIRVRVMMAQVKKVTVDQNIFVNDCTTSPLPNFHYEQKKFHVRNEVDLRLNKFSGEGQKKK
jgi:hypothetical protein